MSSYFIVLTSYESCYYSIPRLSRKCEAKSSQHRIIHRLIRSAEKSSEGEDIVKQNYEMKQEIQILREQIKFLEQKNHLQQQQQQQQQQQEEEWSDTKIINI